MDKQLKRKEQLIKLARSGGTDKELAIIDEVNALEDKVDATIEEVKGILQSTVQKMADPMKGVNMVKIRGEKGEPGKDGRSISDEEIQTIVQKFLPKVINGKDGIDGKDGKTPTLGELLAIIRPLIPTVKDGVTPSDSRLIALIKPLIPKVKNGVDGKNGSPDTGKQIVEKINNSDYQIALEKIEGLNKKLEELEKLAKKNKGSSYSGVLGIKEIVAGSNISIDNSNVMYPVLSSTGGSGTWYQDEVPSGLKNNSNVTYTLAHAPASVVFLYLNGVYQISGTDYTRSGVTITMTVAPLSTDTLIATYS